MYNRFQKTRQLSQGEGKIELTADIHCIGTSGKMARSVYPKLDRNVWKVGVDPGKNVPQLNRACIPCILPVYVKTTIQRFHCTSKCACTYEGMFMTAYDMCT